MATRNECDYVESELPIKTVEEKLAGGLAEADTLREKALGGLATLQRAKLINSRRERSRLAIKLGDDHARVKQLDTKMRAEHAALTGLRAECDRVTATQIERDPKRWQLHGYVRNADGFAQAGHTVALYAQAHDAKGEPIARTRTNDNGYYSFSRQPSGDGKEAARKPRREQVYVGTVDAAGNARIDPCPNIVTAGRLDYLDIVVPVADDGDCGRTLVTRYLGNSGERELHDLDNEKPACHIARIRPDHRFYVRTIDDARKLGFDFCAHCFGRELSRR